MTEADRLLELARSCRTEAQASASPPTAAALRQLAMNCEARAREIGEQEVAWDEEPHARIAA